MLGSGFQWNEPYSCPGWANSFGLTYPLVNDATTTNGPWELFGQGYIPHTTVIGHDMKVVYTAIGSNEAAINEIIVSALNDMETAVGTANEEPLPSDWNLSAAYPNPFNPSTTLEYTIPEAADVLINVYNVGGERVTTLVEGYQQTGQYSIQWDGKAESGNTVSNGMYFIKMMAGDFQQTRQVMFLK